MDLVCFLLIIEAILIYSLATILEMIGKKNKCIPEKQIKMLWDIFHEQKDVIAIEIKKQDNCIIEYTPIISSIENNDVIIYL